MGLDWADAIEEEQKETLEEIQQTALIKKKADGTIAVGRRTESET